STPDASTVYHVGSISKIYTSVLIHQLAEKQQLSLDDLLSKYFPNIVNAEKITISDLLNHRSGIFNFTNSPKYFALMTKPTGQAEHIGIIETFDADFEPGTKADYSNSNYLLLAYIVEQASGKSFEQALDQHILKKIDSKRTSFGKNLGEISNEATSYNYRSSEWVTTTETHMSVPFGAGSIRSTPSELVVFADALFEGKLVNQSSLESMMDIQDGYGRGLFEFPFHDKTSFGHNGGIDGFVSNLSHFPEEDFTIATIFNGVNYNVNDIAVGLLSIYFDESFELPEFSEFEVSPKILNTYAGTYSSEDIPLIPTFFVENGYLNVKIAGNEETITFRAESNTVFKDDKAGVTLTFDKKDSFHFKQGDFESRFNKIEEVEEKQAEDAVGDEMTFATDASIFAGLYKTDAIPLDIEVYVRDGKVSAQATGQGELALTRTSDLTFTYDPAGIVMEFDGKGSFLLKQGGQEITFTRE
ncbi:MAG: beta-lactamase family protein, partial [Saprospiraceae bacterium]|nr:beta-lactamase family protein [Saprospiraceae bacterium]